MERSDFLFGRLDFFKANERARDRRFRRFWVSALENREVGFFFAVNGTAKMQKRRRLDFLAANRTANIKKRRRSDFLSANNRAQNEKLKMLNFFEVNQKVQLQKIPSIGESSKGRCVRKELLQKGTHLSCTLRPTERQ
jgi:hypothetical protein